MNPEQAKQIVDALMASEKARADIIKDTFTAAVDDVRAGLVTAAEAIGRSLTQRQIGLDLTLSNQLSDVELALTQLLAPYVEVPVPPSPVPLAYRADTSREIRPKLGIAPPSLSQVLNDPAFGTRILRVTDAAGIGLPTGVAYAGRSFRTPSSVHARAWSADGAMFYIVTTYGNILPFNAAAFAPYAEARLFGEPNFHPTIPGLLVGATTYDYRVCTWDVARAVIVDTVFDLQQLVSFDLNNAPTTNPGGSGRTYVGDTGISADGNTIFAFFGGKGQDRHYLLYVFDVRSRTGRLLNTMDGTLDRMPITSAVPFGAHIHAANLDRSGRWIKLTWASDGQGPGPFWDLWTNEFKTTTVIVGGHDAYGYNVRVNQAAKSPYDAAQWQLRRLDQLNAPQALINPVQTPTEVYLADHPSWHNAQSNRLVPFITGLFRYYGTNINQADYPWRAWDDEIVAVQTDVPAGTGAAVWRFCHHRSDPAWYSVDTNGALVRNSTKTYFWASPRPQVSPNGLRVLFTSNWGGTLGVDAKGEDGGKARQDVFLAELTGA